MIATKPYIREQAVQYAEAWALDRNPLFFNFTGRGGNCTSFASQVLLAGSCTMNYTPDFGWYYISPEDRAPAWASLRESAAPIPPDPPMTTAFFPVKFSIILL